MFQDPAGVSHTTSYRADVDGLRALAVIPVVLFHAGLAPFSGGYIGVDVFFVISGFLITRILIREMDDGRYSIVEFYRRRARRIFPALFAVTLATLAAGYAILTPDELIELGESAVAIAVFGSNFHFWRSVGYFEAGTQFQPLLHTWSLAVEEQYYIFFPLLLLLVRRKRGWLVGALWAVAAISFALSVALVAWHPSAAFYLLPARAWELMIGGLLAAQCFSRPRSPQVASGAALAGLVLIVVPIFLYDPATPFPGFAALPPSLGAALVIWAEGRGIGRLLSQPVLVSIGLASYSLYLWHLPLIEFAKYLLNGPLPPLAGIVVSLVSLGVAFASLRWIEKPFRQKVSRSRAHRAALVAFMAMPLLAATALAVVLTNGAPWRISPRVAAQLAVIGDQYRHPSACLSVGETWIDPRDACRLGTPNVTPSALLWGDSHAMVTATALESAARRNDAAFLFAADADCPIGIGFGIDSSVSPNLTTEGHYRRCAHYNRAMLEFALNSPEIHAVVLSSRWTNWRIGEPANPAEDEVDVRLRDEAGMARSVEENRAKFERGFTRLVSALTSAGKQVVIVGPLPEPPYNVPHTLYVSRFGFANAPAPIPVAEYERRHATILGFFKRFESNPRVSFVWPAAALCTDGVCPTVREGMPVFFDHNHLTVEAAKATSHLYDRIFEARQSSLTSPAG